MRSNGFKVHSWDFGLGLERRKRACWSAGEELIRVLKVEEMRRLSSKAGSGRWRRMSSRSSGVERTRRVAETILMCSCYFPILADDSSYCDLGGIVGCICSCLAVTEGVTSLLA